MRFSATFNVKTTDTELKVGKYLFAFAESARYETFFLSFIF